MRTALYGRIATSDDQAIADKQPNELRQFAASLGWEVTEEYFDYETGDPGDRPEFRRLFRGAAQGRFDVVLFWVLDQFALEGQLEALQCLQQLRDYGVGFRSFWEPGLNSVEYSSEATTAVLRAIEKDTRARISQLLQDGLNRPRSRGTKSPRPIGRPRVHVNREEAVRLRQQGLSWREIAGKLGAGATTVRRAVNSSKPRQNPLEVGQ